MNTIIIKGTPILKEAEAAAAITPGELIEYTGADVRRHSTIGGTARKAFALENDLIGKGITDSYATGDGVRYGVFYSGCVVYGRTSESVNPGDALESAGNGLLQVSSTAIEGSLVGFALDTVSGAGRCRVEVF
jgi:hypothetical protein